MVSGFAASDGMVLISERKQCEISKEAVLLRILQSQKTNFQVNYKK